MQSLFCAACLLLAVLAPGPALAREPAGNVGELAEKLDDPMTQYAVAGMLSAMSKAVLEMPAEPFVKAVRDLGDSGISRLPPDATLADLTGTDHAKVRAQIVTQVPRAMRAMGAMAGALHAVMPQVEKIARKAHWALPSR